MNLRRWTMDHTKGLLIGITTPILFIPLVIVVIAWLQNYYFSQLWHKFTLNDQYHIKIITISIISNLIWFYYFLNKERFNIAMGVIMGTIAFAPYILYIKFM